MPTLIFADSMDHYSTADIEKKWTTANNGVIVPGSGRNGTSAMRLNGSVNGPALTVSNLPTVYIGYAWKADQGTAVAMLRLLDAGSIQLDLAMNNSGFLAIRRGGGADMLTATTGALSAGSYYHIESRFTLHASAGIVEVRVNGVPVINATGQNLITSSNPYCNSIMLLSGAGNNNYYYDDFFIATDGFCGDCSIRLLFPQAAGNYSQWTPSAGLGYQCVDEASMNGDTDYVSSITAGQRNSYDFAAAGFTGNVKAVQQVTTLRKDDAGSRTVQQFARVGGVDYDGSNISVIDTYSMQRRIMLVNPATGTGWNTADINASEFGAKLVS